MLDVIVLIAMTVTAAAFAVGLVVEAGIPQIPAVIAAAALYMVMAASYLMVSRPSKSAGGSDRMDDLEAALEIIDKDLQRIDKVEDDVSRLDQAVGDYGGGERTGGQSNLAQITQEIEDVHGKIENLRADLEGEAREQRTKITNDLRGLEMLIKQLSADLVSTSAETLAEPEEEGAGEEPEPAPLAEIEKIEPEPQAEDIVFEAETITVAVEEEGEEAEPETETIAIAVEEEKAEPEAEMVAIAVEGEEEVAREAETVAAEEEATPETETVAIEEGAAPETEAVGPEEEKEEAAREAETFAVPVEEEKEEVAREAEMFAVPAGGEKEVVSQAETIVAEQEEEAAPEAETATVAVEVAEELVLREETSAGLVGESAREASAGESPSEQELPEATGAAEIGDSEMLEIISQAIEAGRIDLYLQPTVTLPERRPRYLEAFTRIRTNSDSLIRPRSYLPAAETSGMMPLIDNVLLVKSVQMLRRLGPGSRIKGIFCNISVSTLLDPEFFPELVEFMEENSGLSENLVFEIGQAALLGLGQTELGALDTLAALGYGFSLDHVAGFDLDFVGLRERSFRFVKFDVRTFLSATGGQGGAFSAADMMRALDDFDIKLIVEKVADEDSVAELLDRGVKLAQGYLFGRPKPLSPALLSEIEGAGAA